MKLRLIHIRENKKLEIYQVFGLMDLSMRVYRVAYEIQENKVIPVLLCGTHNNFLRTVEKNNLVI